MNAAADNKDWRQKYTALVHSLEAEEQQHQAQLQSLRRLLSRLCLLGQGQSPELDHCLQQLKALLARDGCDSAAFEALHEKLAQALRACEQQRQTSPTAATASGNAPQPATAQTDRLRAILDALLQELRRDPQLAASVDSLQEELRQPSASERWPGLLERCSALVTRRIRQLDQRQQGLQALLGQLASSLDQMAQFAAGNAAQLALQARERDSFANLVGGEVQALAQSLDRGDALSDLRLQLGSRLASIAQHLQVFRRREATTLSAMQSRNQQMQSRIRELEQQAEQLRQRLQQEQHAALLDPLTGIPNRLAWDRHCAEMLTQPAGPTCIAVWDVDHFKAINDECGHAAGDRALRHVADCLRRHLRSSDFLARYGGEEFVLLLPGTTLEDALGLAERIREAVTRIGFHVGGQRRPLSISAGLTRLRPGDSAGSAFERADAALYRAKNGGRNRVEGD
jgi:diguanylate cyclase